MAEERCPVCKGAGKINDKSCSGCGGRGVRWAGCGYDVTYEENRAKPAPILFSGCSFGRCND